MFSSKSFVVALAFWFSTIGGINALWGAALCAPCLPNLLQSQSGPHICDSTGTRSSATRHHLEALARYLDKTALDQPHALLFLDIVFRWFGGDRYADASRRYELAVEARPREAHVLRVFRRVMDRAAPLHLEDLDNITTDFDPMTARALHCDRIPLQSDYVGALLDAAQQGGYSLTHALLAWAWLKENGCRLEVPAGFETAIVRDTAALIDDDRRVSDLEIEAAALLYAFGHGDRLPSGFIARVVDAQLPSGGFSLDSGGEHQPNWHTSVLAYWLLLQDACPANEKRMMLARSSRVARSER